MQSSLLLRFWIGATGVVGLVGVLLICRQVTFVPRPVKFKTVQEFKELITSDGLHCHCGNASGLALNNFYVADRPITLDDLKDVQTRRDCGLTTAWRGIIWVTQIHYGVLTLCLDVGPSGKRRVWGNVLVAGDEELMDRVEAAFQSR